MNISNHDNKILSLLLKERTSMQSKHKSLQDTQSIDKLTKAINGIRNNIVYTEMVVNSPSSNTKLLKKGETITLRIGQ